MAADVAVPASDEQKKLDAEAARAAAAAQVHAEAEEEIGGQVGCARLKAGARGFSYVGAILSAAAEPTWRLRRLTRLKGACTSFRLSRCPLPRGDSVGRLSQAEACATIVRPRADPKCPISALHASVFVFPETLA